MPGSGTDAFRGLSVFIGLLVSFGSSGLVNQVMSGFMITYSRAIRAARVRPHRRLGGHGDAPWRALDPNQDAEERGRGHSQRGGRRADHHELLAPAGKQQVYTTTSLTIGYDTPWRQVHGLLLAAAEKTPGLCAEPAPVVYQTSLDDFYVKYTLFVCLEQQDARLVVLNALYANIQDQFNAYGVQIMSPNYVIDPKDPKIVPKDQWYAAPARPAAVPTAGV